MLGPPEVPHERVSPVLVGLVDLGSLFDQYRKDLQRRLLVYGSMEQRTLGLTIDLVDTVSLIEDVIHHSGPGWLRTIKVYSQQVLPIFEDVIEAFRTEVVEVLLCVVVNRLL